MTSDDGRLIDLGGQKLREFSDGALWWFPVAEPGEVSTTPDTTNNTVPTDTDVPDGWLIKKNVGLWPESAGAVDNLE